MTRPEKLQTNHARGVLAESYAKAFLEKSGYKIIQQRYKTRYGEIDFIVTQKNLLCFVEVKSRKSIEEALSSILPRSRQRIENAALFFLSEYPDYASYDMRFDVVAISEDGSGQFQVTHLDNAWEAGS